MIELSNTARATMGFRRQVHAKTNGKCFFCGVDVRCADEDLPRDWLLVKGGGLTMVPDHAHPKARGGEDGIDNRLPSCGWCNSAKGWLTVEEFRCLKGLRAGDLSFSFACEEPRVTRDWLCVHSEDRERELFLHNQPWARDGYSRGKSIRKRRKAAERRGDLLQ
jgi:hypothetical protein